MIIIIMVEVNGKENIVFNMDRTPASYSEV